MTQEEVAANQGLAAEVQPLWKALVGFGTVTAGLTAAGILLGYQYYVAYLRELGAPWLVSEIGTATFLRAGGGIVWPAVLGALMVTGLTLTVDKSPHRFLRGLIFFLDVLAVAALGIALLRFPWTPPALTDFCRGAVQPLYGVSLGMTVVTAFDRVARGEADRARSRVWVGYLIASSLFVYIPSTVGRLDGQTDAAPETSRLVIAQLPDDPGHAWRLLTLEGGNALLYIGRSESNPVAVRIADIHGLTFGGRPLAQPKTTQSKPTPGHQ